MTKKIISLAFSFLVLPILVSAQTAGTSYTASQVASHSSSADCFIIVSGNVYSVSSYITMHPGGSSTIINQCGKDATVAFNTKGGRGSHSSGARSTLGTFLIGILSTPTTPVPTPNPLPTPKPIPTTSSTPTEMFTTCLQTSVEKRDTSIVAARTSYGTAINAALITRKEAEKSAIAITNVAEKRIALKKVANDYRTTTRGIQSTLTSTRKLALSTFETEIKGCQNTRKTANTKIKEGIKRSSESSTENETKGKNLGKESTQNRGRDD